MMAKPIANVDIQTDTYETWIQRTNEIIDTVNNEALTANSTVGVTGTSSSPRNSRLFGVFTSNTITGNSLFSNTMVVSGVANVGSINVTGAANTGSLIVTGNTTLGDNTADTITINGSTILLPANVSFDSGTLFIDPTTNRVGVGNTSPLHSLSVAGNTFVSGHITVGTGIVANGSTGTSGYALVSNGTGGVFWSMNPGYTGSVGAQGATGYTGSGSPGGSGAQGAQGATGPQGVQGATGFTGSVGAQGATGPQGVQGATGPQGVQGSTGFTGSVGTQGSAGAQGPAGIGSQGNVSWTVGTFGVGTAASGVQGEIRATNNITAYYSSDRRLKENIQPIENALDKLRSISGVMFDWSKEYMDAHGGEDGYFIRRRDTGVIAQEVEDVLPEVVATREDGTKAVKYDRIVGLIIQAVKELADQVDIIKNRL